MFQEIKQHRKFRSTLMFIIQNVWSTSFTHLKIYPVLLCYGWWIKHKIKENFSSYCKSPLQCRIFTGIFINVPLNIHMFESEGRKEAFAKTAESHWRRWCPLRWWWKRSWGLCGVFSVTQTAAICRKDTEMLGKQVIICVVIPAYGYTVCTYGPYTITGMADLLKQYYTVSL